MTNNNPFDELKAQFDSHLERLSAVEREQLRAVLATQKEGPLEPQSQERPPAVSLSAVLQESPYRPSDRLTAVVAMLDTWLTQPQLDPLLTAIIDQLYGE